MKNQNQLILYYIVQLRFKRRSQYIAGFEYFSDYIRRNMKFMKKFGEEQILLVYDQQAPLNRLIKNKTYQYELTKKLTEKV